MAAEAPETPKGRRRRRLVLAGSTAAAVLAVAVTATIVQASYDDGTVDAVDAVETPGSPDPSPVASGEIPGSGTLGDSPTPSASPSPSKSKAAAPKAASGGRPGADNTGVPAGVSLTRYTGPLRITRTGTVIDGKQINGCLDIRARNVVVKRSKIICGEIMLKVAESDASLTVEDSDLDGAGSGFVAGYWNYTLRRVDVYAIQEGPRIGSQVLIEGSWMHDMRRAGPDAHQDLLQTNGGSNSTIRNNVFDATSPSREYSFNAVFQVGAEFEALRNFTFVGNYCDGGGYAINIRDDPGISNVVFRNNKFGRKTDYGPVARADAAGISWESSNVFADNGKAVW